MSVQTNVLEVEPDSGDQAEMADTGRGGSRRGLVTGAWSAVIPAEKDLPPEWEQGLYERGMPRVYEGDSLMKIGMPVGGVCAGLVYLGGDGKLWYWDILNRYLSGVQPRQIQYKGRSWHGLPQGLGAWQGGNGAVDGFEMFQPLFLAVAHQVLLARLVAQGTHILFGMDDGNFDERAHISDRSVAGKGTCDPCFVTRHAG